MGRKVKGPLGHREVTLALEKDKAREWCHSDKAREVTGFDLLILYRGLFEDQWRAEQQI